MKNRAAAFFSILGLVLLLVVVVLCVPVTLPRIFGYEAYAIISGSMEPEIATGSIVYAKNIEPESVKEGDVIVFYGGADGTAVTTHRVIENRTSERQFITKGDANAENDFLPVAYDNLIGRVERSVPALGKVLPALSDKRIKIYLICILIGAVFFRFLGGRLRQ